MTKSVEIKRRLLEAAGEEFAKNGADAASVRVICERAGVNLAAVNYHFRGKGQLYREAVAEAFRRTAVRAPEGGTPAEQLRAFVRESLVGAAEGGWPYRLVLREVMHPTPAAGDLAERIIRPRFEQLVAVLRLACPAADDRRLRLLALSVAGQCLCYRSARPATARLLGPEEFAALDPDAIVDHVTTFSLAALGLAPPLGRPGSGDAPEGWPGPS